MSAQYDFAGHAALITGGSAGIGLSIATRLADSGAQVGIIDPAPLPDSVIERYGSRIQWLPADVTDSAAIDSVVDTFNASNPATLLVNNAGASVHAAPEDYDLDDWNRVIGVNLSGTFILSRAVFRARDTSKSLSIVNLSSIAGKTSLGRGIFAYAAAKAGIEQLSRDLAIEWATFDTRVNAVAPCQVATPGYEVARDRVASHGEDMRTRALEGIPLGRFATSDEIASAVLFLLSDEAAMITGTTLAVDGGNLALNAGGSLRG